MAHQTPAVAGLAEQLLAGDVRFREARNAVYVVFFGNGFLFANCAGRNPQVRAGLGVTPRVLGLILGCLVVGSGIGTPLSRLIISRLGESRTVSVMAVAAGAGWPPRRLASCSARLL
jgi:hypothetical protein